jgi:hypothetical protein
MFDLKEKGYEVVDWIRLSQNNVQWHISKYGNESLDSIKWAEFLD